jgi:hypothetical protein
MDETDLQMSDQLENQKDVWVENDIVYFKDRTAFKDALTELHRLDVDELEAWEKTIGFSNSYRKILNNQLSDELIDDKDEFIIEDMYFASVVNQQGVFVLNDTIHKITYSTEYVIPDLDFEKLNKINDGVTERVNNVETFKIKRGIFKEPSEVVLKSVSGWETKKKRGKDDGFKNDDLGVDLKCWCVNYLAYASIGVRIIGREDSWRGWKNRRMDYAKVDGCAYYRLNWQDDEIIDCGSDDGVNEKKVAKTLTWVLVNINVCDSISCEYTYEDVDGDILTWDIKWK